MNNEQNRPRYVSVESAVAALADIKDVPTSLIRDLAIAIRNGHTTISAARIVLLSCPEGERHDWMPSDHAPDGRKCSKCASTIG